MIEIVAFVCHLATSDTCSDFESRRMLIAEYPADGHTSCLALGKQFIADANLDRSQILAIKCLIRLVKPPGAFQVFGGM